MAITWNGLTLDDGQDGVVFDGIDFSTRPNVEVVEILQRDGDISLVHGKRGFDFTAAITSFGDGTGSPATIVKERYDNLVEKIGESGEMEVFGVTIENILLRGVSNPKVQASTGGNIFLYTATFRLLEDGS